MVKITDKMIKTAYNCARAGNFRHVIATSINITIKELEIIMKQGEKDLEEAVLFSKSKSEFAKLYEMIIQGESENEQSLVDYIENAGVSDWKAASWLLERRYSERWQPKKDENANKDKVINVSFSDGINFSKI